MRLTLGHIFSFVAGVVLTTAFITFIAGIRATPQESIKTVIRPVLQKSTAASDANLKQNRHVDIRVDRTKRLPNHEKVECCLKVAEDIDRQLAERLRQQNLDNPDAFAVQLQYNGQRLLDLCTLRSQDPALYTAKLQEMRFDSEIIKFGVGLCQAANDGNEQMVVNFEDQLRSTLMMQLVFEIKARGDFLRKLQEEVERLRSELDVMASQFEATVNTRLSEIKNCELPLRPSWQQRSRTVVPSHDLTDIPPE